MSSDDVIELGSSDEDPEPAPKRSKPMPNAMVCIPRKFNDVTIKPAKLNLNTRHMKSNPLSRPVKTNPTYLSKGIGNPITVTKVTGSKPPPLSKTKYNGSPKIQQHKPKLAINPLSDNKCPKPALIQTKPSNSKMALVKTTKIKPIIEKKIQLLKNPIKIQNSNIINLPPSITVKKTGVNRPIVFLNVKAKQQINNIPSSVGDVLTVELDDEDTSTHKSSPQWYLRPEEQTETSALDEENNKEPEGNKLIEITIEDSPVKPIHNKRTHEVGAELAITIDDSPVKAPVTISTAGSDSENEDNIGKKSIPHSKKKLEYPKEAEDSKTVEIEIDPIVINPNMYEKLDDVVIVDVTKYGTNTEKECKLTPPKENNTEEKKISDVSEFHPVYQSFIDLCFQLENSEDMKKIVEKKIKGYYRQVPKKYTESEEFTDMVSSKILAMKAGPEKMYLYIKDIVDELNMQRKFAKAQPPAKEIKMEELPEMYGENSNYDSKRQRQIRKLEKTIKKLHRAIQKLEEQEVDFDDEDDSVYILTERYKERMVRVYAKFCQLSNTKMPSEPRIQIDPRPGQPSGPAKRLEKWINKKVPIGTPLPFPDFHDVLRCVREANEADNLNLNEVDIMEEARDLFTRCGKKLQRRRQENEWRSAASRIALEVDPAENNEELQKKLNENRKVSANKETEIFNKFADRQKQLKLEAKEIGDKEAEESPVESEEEETNDDSASLENTEKRKERLKRLLQEKSRKSLEEKENQPSNEDEKNDNGTSDIKMDEGMPTKLITDKESERKEEDDTIKEVPKQTSNKEEDASKEIVEQDNEKKENNTENKEQSNNDVTTENAETLTLSDDSNELESDIDELHLLQKLHSGNDGRSSSVDSSDCSPIAISDSLESSGNENDMSDANCVISIENSSYSEDENDKIGITQASNTDSVQFIDETQQMQEAEADIPTTVDIEVPMAGAVHAPAQTNNDECNGAVEDILLASSEDDNSQGAIESVCVNLKDDLITIDETVIRKDNNKSIVVNNQASKKEDSEMKSTKVYTGANKSPGTTGKLDKKKDESIQKNNEIIVIENSNDKFTDKMDVDEDNFVSETEKSDNSKNNSPLCLEAS